MVADMYDVCATGESSELWNKKDELVNICQPFTRTLAGCPVPAQTCAGAKYMHFMSRIPKLALQRLGETQHALLRVGKIIPGQENPHPASENTERSRA